MSTQTIENSTEQTSARAFHNSDYRKAARLVRSMRHVRGDRYTPKPEAQMDAVSALALTLVQIFEADAEQGGGAPFSAEFFMAGTELPAKPSYPAYEPEQDDEDEDN